MAEENDVKKLLFAVLAAVSVAAGAAELDEISKDGFTVRFASCPKCAFRMRLAADGRSATVNLSRIKDDAPDAATVLRRSRARAERAFALMRMADDTRRPGKVKRPLLGWSSWNTFGCEISEPLILSVAQAMATNGLKAAGYRYVNIDDGFFYGHGPDGRLAGKLKTVFGKHGDTGITRDEEVMHFGLWCMMSSPLLIGCDPRTIDPETLELVTNPFLLAMNQNDLGLGGYVVQRTGEAYVLVKDAVERFGKARFVALCNATDAEHEFTVPFAALDLGGKVEAFDLVERADIGELSGSFTMRVPAHGARFLRLDAERRLDRTVYAAEDAGICGFPP